ncbi:hypothetical protein QEH40_gp31 [Microbacterium phage OscarSo]|uniref:Uncharacterized protein n=1 Tax=Microbacterium phage OscarSo TaxID=2985324 RepID=A0A9X9K357_9CAUD|nr:hypothetical protein QEH40_gp31 [Microbacterium phage OscarSo]UYL87152.1 hypothetical protein SEA_OSCARSO_31 [Microbacterium phage OscarSo]
MDVWTWVASSFPAGAVMSGVGVGAFVTAILTDRLMTRGQHLRRTADLVEHHNRELGEKDARISELRESKDGWKEVALAERARADAATDIGEEVGEALERIGHVLGSLNVALPDPPKGHGNV